MGIPLRLLMLEDNPSDAELSLHALRRAGYDPTSDVVETEEDFLAHLQPAPEIILADFTMPQFDSLRALEILQERRLDIPFIIVSGTIGEERAVRVMQSGATDYIIKDRLERLGLAVAQALARWRLKEEKLHAEQAVAQLAAIVETSGDAIITTTLAGLVTSWNHAAERLYGYSMEEILGKNISVLIPRGRRMSDAAEDQDDMNRRLSEGEHIDGFETVRVRKDGRRRDVFLSLSPIRDANRIVTGASAIAHDITQRKRSERYLSAEQAVTSILAESKSLEEAGPRVLQTIAECMRWEIAVLWTIDSKLNVLRRMTTWHAPWADARFIEVMSQKAILEPGMGLAGRAWSTAEPAWESGAEMDRRVTKSSATAYEGLRGGFSLPMRQGAEIVGIIEFYNPELRQPDKLLLATLDNIACQIGQLWERGRTELALVASEEQFRQLADAMPQIVWTARMDGKIDYFNERWYQFAACSREASLEQAWRSIVHPDDLQRTQDVWTHCVQTGAPLEMEIRLVEGKTGRPRWFLVRAIAATGSNGAITRWHGTATDIDDQRRNLEELRVSEERFRNLVMALPAAVYTTDKAGRITLFNEHAVELWGRRPILGQDYWCGSSKLLRLDGVPLSVDQYPMAVAVREGRGVRGEELIVERPDGSRAYVLKHPELLRGPAGEIVGAVNMVIDITKMKLLEAQYRQAQKMEAVGQLAAGVAHDFNNLLTVILGYGELILSGMPAVHPDREPMVQICNAGESAAALTRQLLAFGRKQILSPEVFDLNALLIEINKMLQRLIGEDIELVTHLQPGLGYVKADPGQVEQIIMNLVVNARDAMPRGGRLVIQTENAAVSESQVQRHADCAPGPYTLLAVSDTGCGMDEATKAHIFEPFFTTKEIGRGTGLGLATVFGIVKQSGGFLEVESTPGSGAAFRIYLPQTAEASPLNQADIGVVQMPVGTETILLVEDEDGVRDLARLLLEAGGYRVLCAGNGDDAVRACHDYADVIHLLLTDVVMPKMGGRRLADLLLPSRPDMKVLYMSGYTGDTMMRHGILDAETNFLSKPFTPLTLVRKVRDVLDGPKGT